MSIEADLTTLASDRTARDTKMTTDGLETDDFPEASFTMSEDATLPGTAGQGDAP